MIEKKTLDILKNKRILITGASGLLGRQLLYEFVRAGVRPTALVRDCSKTEYSKSLNLEIRRADFAEQSSLEAACADMDVVIHTAAIVDFGGDGLEERFELNSFGALRVFCAAREAGVSRFVQISSVVGVGAVAFGGKPLNEDSEFNLDHLQIPYILSKHQAEELLLAEPAGQTELIIVNPSIIVAPSRHQADRKRIDRAFARKVIPSLPNRLNLVDIRDVSRAILLATAHGRDRRRYLLTGENISVRQILDILCGLTGQSPLRLRPPLWPLKLAAALARWRYRRKPEGKLKLYPDLVKMLEYDWTYDNSRAISELGFTSRPLEETLSDLYNERFQGTFLDS